MKSIPKRNPDNLDLKIHQSITVYFNPDPEKSLQKPNNISATEKNLNPKSLDPTHKNIVRF